MFGLFKRWICVAFFKYSVKIWKFPDTHNNYTTLIAFLKCIFLRKQFWSGVFWNSYFQMHFFKEHFLIIISDNWLKWLLIKSPHLSKIFLINFSELLYLIYCYSEDSFFFLLFAIFLLFIIFFCLIDSNSSFIE